MKVLHVIPSLSHVHGGPTRALVLMEQALAAQGITVETATTDDDGPGQRNEKASAQPLLENGTPHRYFPKRVEFYKISPAFGRWISGEARHYDLIHIHALFSFTTSAAAWAADRAGVPYVVRPLGTLNDYGMKQRRPWLKSLSMQLIESRVLRRAAAVHFTSEEEAAEARMLGVPFRAAVIPLAVEVPATATVSAEPSPFSEPQLPSLLFLSRLDPKKNIEGLLDAIALLRNEGASFNVVIAGDGTPAYVRALKTRAVALGISEHVVWAGHLEGDAKMAAFSAADFFVLPSFSENFGIAAAEALAAGLPCVLGKGVAVAKYVVQAEAGVAVEPDAPGISDGLRRMICDRDGLMRMSANAKRLARDRFSLQVMGASLKQLYTDILNGSNEFSRSR